MTVQISGAGVISSLGQPGRIGNFGSVGTYALQSNPSVSKQFLNPLGLERSEFIHPLDIINNTTSNSRIYTQSIVLSPSTSSTISLAGEDWSGNNWDGFSDMWGYYGDAYGFFHTMEVLATYWTSAGGGTYTLTDMYGATFPNFWRFTSTAARQLGTAEHSYASSANLDAGNITFTTDTVTVSARTSAAANSITVWRLTAECLLDNY